VNYAPIQCWECPWWGDPGILEDPRPEDRRYCWYSNTVQDGDHSCGRPGGVLRQLYRDRDFDDRTDP